jgi:16S rRNA processing protein RimM
MEVWTQTDEFLGKIEDILDTGSNDVYVVRHEGKEVLIPALQHVIIDIALDAGIMTVALPDGLR